MTTMHYRRRQREVIDESCAPEGGRVNWPAPTTPTKRERGHGFWIVVAVSLTAAAILIGIDLAPTLWGWINP